MPSPEQLEAFEKYDFGGDSRWIDYYNNLTIPPGRSDGAAIVRRYKQKFYKQHVNPEFEVESLEEAARATSGGSRGVDSGPRQTSQARTAQREPAGRQPDGPTSSAGSASAANRPARSAVSLRSTEFLGNAWVIVMAIVAAFPLSPSSLSLRCFRFCLMGSIVMSVLNIFKRYGRPRALNWEGIKLWAQQCLSGPEVLALMHCLAFFTSPRPVVMACVPLACHLTPSVAGYLQTNFSRAQLYQRYLDKPCSWLTSNKVQVELFAANLEITLGFLVIVFMLTPQRNLLQAIFYWQLLKLSFHSPASQWYHRQVWSQLGAVVEPFLQRYVPFVLTPLGYVKSWFTRAA